MVQENVIIRFRADGARTVNRDVQGIGGAARRSADSVAFLKKALVFVGVGSAIRGLTRTLASFEQEISTVRAVSGATGKEFAALRDRAKELGATTRFSATQAAEGLTQLARAGFDSQKAIDTVDDTLRLAQAGALDLATAAQITAGAIRGFRVGTDQAERFVDVLAATANSAATDVTELGEAMKFVAPAAASLKVPFETASAALATLADNQLRGTLGGTGLRKVLSTLAKGGKPLEQALQRVGLSLEDVDVPSVGLTNALRALEKASLDTGEAFVIFGDRGQPAFDVLVNNIDKVDAFDRQLQAAGGTAQRVADIMDDNLNGSLLRVRSAFEAVQLSLGELGATSILTTLLENLAAGLRFAADNADKLTEAIVAGLVPAVVVLTTVLRLNPIGLLVSAIAAVIPLLVLFRDELKLGGDSAATAGDLFRAMAENIRFAIDAVKPALEGIFGPFLEESSRTLGEVEDGFVGFARTVARIFDGLAIVPRIFVSAVGVAFTKLPAAIAELFFDMVNRIIRAFNGLSLRIQRFINGALEQLQVLATQGAGVIDRVFGGDGIIDLGAGSVALPQLGEITNRFEDAGREAGDAFRFALEREINGPGGAEQILNGLLAGAELQAQERLAGQNQAAVAAQRQNTAGAFFEGGLQNVTEAFGAGSSAFANAGGGTEELAGQNSELSRKQEILGQLRQAEAERIANTTAINELLAEGSITQAEYNTLLEELPNNIEASTSAWGGFVEAIKEVDTSAQALGASIGNALTSAIGQASGALADFVVTGLQNTEDLKQAFSDLLKNLAKQILQVIIQTLILKAIQASIGGFQAGGPIGGLSGAQAGGFIGGLQGRQAGGPTREPVLVGEQGPEIFVPTQTGNVVPNSKIGQPEVNVQVVNVRDPGEIPAALDTPEAQEKIINLIRDRRREIDA